MEKEIPKLKENDTELEEIYDMGFSEKQIQQVIYGWLFENKSYRTLESTELNNPNDGNTVNDIMRCFGLYDKSENGDSFKNIFQGNTIDQAIRRLENANNGSDFTKIIDLLKSIDLENLYDNIENDEDLDSYFSDQSEDNNIDENNQISQNISFDDALNLIRDVLNNQGFKMGNNNDYEAVIVKKLPAADIIPFNKPKNHYGKLTHIAYTTTMRNMFPYLRVEGYDDENKKDYLTNFFVINIPIFLDYSNLNYLRDNFQSTDIRGNVTPEKIKAEEKEKTISDEDNLRITKEQDNRLSNDVTIKLKAIDSELSELNSSNTQIKSHATVFIKPQDSKDQLGLSQKATDDKNFYLMRELLFADDFFIILKRKAIFEYEAYGLKYEDGQLLMPLDKKFKTSYNSNKNSTPVNIDDFQIINYAPNRIFFGAPGTGKSFTLNQQKDNIICDEQYYERVTFHPDYSYANFVGTYKPIKEKNKETNKEEITYDFVPGPFLRVFVEAIKNQIEAEKNINELKIFLLIIEEINRANVSAVFGDVFQLLDRDENNVSEYSINVSEDIKNHLIDKLNKELDDGFGKEDYEKYFPNNEIKIPNNMFIWATMNSADQGVFPIDTAFKRRWDFEYMPINNNQELIKNLEIESDDEIYNWNRVRKAINKFLLDEGINEDKLMGPFFIKENSYKDITQLFKDKVLMYLYEDAAKPIRDRLFKGSKDECESFSYLEICNDFQERGVQIFHINIINEINKNENTSESINEKMHNEEEK